jgi:hypothetical protein
MAKANTWTPYIVILAGSMATLLTSGVFYVIRTTVSDVPDLRRDIDNLRERMDTHMMFSQSRSVDVEQRLRVCEGRIFPIPNGPYRGDRR